MTLISELPLAPEPLAPEPEPETIAEPTPLPPIDSKPESNAALPSEREIDPAPISEVRPESPPERLSEPTPVIASEPRPDETPFEIAPTPPTVTATQLMAQFEKYRLDDELPLLRIEEQPAEPRALGHINQKNLLAMLDKPLPRLPFADPDTPFVFYSTGFKGQVERLLDKITRRSSHTTKWGTKIECVYTLIGVFCGWG